MTQQPPPPPPPPYGGGPVQQNGLALAGMVVGIVGILLALLIPIGGVVIGLVGLVLSLVGRTRARATGIGAGQAVAGITTGAAAIVISVLMYFVYLNALT